MDVSTVEDTWIRSINFSGTTFTLKAITGLVQEIREKDTTYVSGTTENINTTISSSQTFFLTTQSGREKAIELRNFPVSARGGNLLTLMWVIPPGKDTGYYCIAYNHDQGKLISSDRFLGEMVYTKNFGKTLVIYAAFIVVLGLLLFPIGIAIGAVVAYIYNFKAKKKDQKKQGEQFLGTADFKAFASDLEKTDKTRFYAVPS